MYCKNCGKKIDDQARFCVYCGAPQNNEGWDTGEEKSWNQENERRRETNWDQENRGQPKKGGKASGAKRVMIPAIAGILAISLPAAALLYMHKNSTGKETVNVKKAQAVISADTLKSSTLTAASAEEAGMLTGSVYYIDAQTGEERPLSGAEIVAADNKGKSMKTTSNENGAYSFSLEPSRKYTLVYSYNGWTFCTSDTVTIEEGESIALNGICMNKFIKGTVVSADSGEILQNVSISLLKDQKTVVTGTSYETGEFSMMISEPGQYQLVFNLDGYTEKVISITADGIDRNIELTDQVKLKKKSTDTDKKKPSDVDPTPAPVKPDPVKPDPTPADDPVDPDPTPAVPSLADQIQTIVNYSDVWKDHPNYSVKNTEYAITDLNQNGLYEIEVICSDVEYGIDAIYEVNPGLDGLTCIYCSENSDDPNGTVAKLHSNLHIAGDSLAGYYNAASDTYYYFGSTLEKLENDDYGLGVDEIAVSGSSVSNSGTIGFLGRNEQQELVYELHGTEYEEEAAWRMAIDDDYSECQKFFYSRPTIAAFDLTDPVNQLTQLAQNFHLSFI